VLHDLRRLFAEIGDQSVDPTTRFCETVLETSALKVLCGHAEQKVSTCVGLACGWVVLMRAWAGSAHEIAGAAGARRGGGH